MIVNRVDVINLDKLVDSYYIGQSNPNLKKSFGSNVSILLNKVQINLEISDISILELYFMKKFATSVGGAGIPNINTESFVNSVKNPEKHGIINKMVVLNSVIKKDTDVDAYRLQMVPVGVVRYDKVNVSFRGIDILSFSNGFIEKLVTDIREKKSDEDLDSYFISNFLQNFYTFMMSKLSEVDLLSEFSIASSYYKYITFEEEVKLAEVHCPTTSIRFFGKDSSTLNEDLARMREWVQSNPHDKNNIQYYFVMNTDFYTFLLFNIYSSLVQDHEPFKILLGSEADAVPPRLNIEPDILEIYSNRISKLLKDYTSIKNMVTTDSNSKIDCYHYILINQKIKYGIMVDLNSEKFDKEVSILNKKGGDYIQPCLSEIVELISRILKIVN